MSSGHSQLAESGLNQVLRLWTPGPGPLYRGLAAALREAIQRGQLPDGSRLPSERQLAERLLISLTTAPEQVLVTPGAQQAIDLAARLLVRPGDAVVVENPTFPGALDTIASAGARFACVRTTHLGADVEEIEQLAARVQPRLLYVI